MTPRAAPTHHSPWRRLIGGLLVVVLATSALPVTSSSAPEGSGESYWGPVAPPDSANTAALPGRPKPTWEKVVNLPYVILFFPLKLVFMGVEAAAGSYERDPDVRKFVSAFPLRMGPALISGAASYGTSEGFGLGVSLDVPDFDAAHHAFNLRLSGQTAGDRRATTGLRLRHGDQSWFDLGGGYRNSHSARYFGIGFDTPEDAQSFYQRELSWGGVTWHRDVGESGFFWALTGFYSGVAATGSGRTGNPHLSEEFADDLPPGYRTHSEGLTAGLELQHENTELLGPPHRPVRERGRPERGGVRRAAVSWFEGKGNTKAAFWTWRVEAQQFVPLWYSRRALAVRAYVSRIENEGDDPVPFQRLLTNDDPDVFRGYTDERFHDLGIAAATVEYRWPIWALNEENSVGADAYLFADWGQVFQDFDQITSDHLTKSYGGGLRVGGDGRFSGRIELGYSEEGTEFRLRADQLFQFERGGLFNGRGPVPDR